MALDFTYLHTRQANHRSAYCVGVGFFCVTMRKVRRIGQRGVAALGQQAAAHAAVFELGRRAVGERADDEHADVLLAGQHGGGARRDRRRGDDFDELPSRRWPWRFPRRARG